MNEDLAGTAQRETTTDPGWDIPGFSRSATEPGGLFATEAPKPAGRRDSGGSRRGPLSARPDAGRADSLVRADALVTRLKTGSPQGEWRPDGPVQALSVLTSALDYLAHADPASWTEDVQADCLRVLAAAESRQVAAHARVLATFSAPGGGLARDSIIWSRSTAGAGRSPCTLMALLLR